MALSVTSGAKPEVVFTRAVAKPPSKLNLTIDGPEKTWKSHTSLTAPGPIAYHSFENGLHRVIDKFPDKEIYSFEYSFPATLKLPGTELAGLSDASTKVWTEFVTNLRASVERCRSIVIDTGTKAWDLLRIARLGKLTQVMPIQYTAVNQEFNELVQVLHRSPANIIWLHRVKPVYENDKKTGEVVRAGYGDMAFEVDAVIRMLPVESKNPAEQVQVRFGACGSNRKLSGSVLEGEPTFATIATAIYPSTNEENWK